MFDKSTDQPTGGLKQVFDERGALTALVIHRLCRDTVNTLNTVCYTMDTNIPKLSHDEHTHPNTVC